MNAVIDVGRSGVGESQQRVVVGNDERRVQRFHKEAQRRIVVQIPTPIPLQAKDAFIRERTIETKETRNKEDTPAVLFFFLLQFHAASGCR